MSASDPATSANGEVRANIHVIIASADDALVRWVSAKVAELGGSCARTIDLAELPIPADPVGWLVLLVADASIDAAALKRAISLASDVLLDDCLGVIEIAADGRAKLGEFLDVAGTLRIINPQALERQFVPAFLQLATDLKARASTSGMQQQIEKIGAAVSDLGQRLKKIGRNDSRRVTALESVSTTTLAPAQMAQMVRRIIAGRKLRDRFFTDARFGEPAWDVLLDLTLAWLEEKPVSVSSACIAAGVPTSTAMRWISELIDRGIIERQIDPADGRRHLVQMTLQTRNAMLQYLASIAAAFPGGLIDASNHSTENT